MLLAAAVVVSADMLTLPERRVRLLGDETNFRAAFARFGPNDELNGLTLAKLERFGQEAELLHAYDDGTVTVRFDDGREHDMPIEALAAEHRGLLVERRPISTAQLQLEVAEAHGLTDTPLTATNGSVACDASVIAGEISCIHLNSTPVELLAGRDTSRPSCWLAKMLAGWASRNDIDRPS